jgi:CBS domain-containing protein
VIVCGRPIFSGNRLTCSGDVDHWFERAAGGTLFIDRVGDLSTSAQGRLLSLLTEQSHDRSATRTPHQDRQVRIITGSDRSLRADLAVGTFSDALFYRLNVIHIDQLHRDEPGEEAMRARDLMSKPPYTCGPGTDLATVAKIMWDHDCGFVPVVDASGTATGVVTDRDICIATSTRRLLPEQLSAAQAMTAPIHACLSEDSISDVLATMRRFQVRRVPVVDVNGRLQGVISLNDIVLASNDTREPRASEVVATMAAICAHRRVETAVA